MDGTFLCSIQKLPLTQAMILSFTTPLTASVAARFILHENLKIAELGGTIKSVFKKHSVINVFSTHIKQFCIFGIGFSPCGIILF